MRNKTAVILIAAALVSGNVMSGVAGNFKVNGKDPTPRNGFRVQQQHQSPVAPVGPGGFQAKSFKAKCVNGFSKIDEHKVNMHGVPVIQSFECRTAWIECPDLPAYNTTNSEIEIQEQGTGDASKRYRVWYRCWGYNPEG